MSNRTVAKTALTVAGVTAVTGLLAYAVYFDYKRRNDTEFRRKLRKEKKKADKTKAQEQPSADSSTSASVSPDELRTALEKVRGEEIPQTAEQKEQYFMSQVSMGEQLCQQGPLFQLPAALCFYRALRVYPSPVELIMIYEKTVPPPVFQLVMEMTNMDVSDRVGGYYNAFPAKSMNVHIKDLETSEADGPVKKRKALFASRDFEAGETIYTEEAVVAVLDSDVQAAGTHCTHCLREIPAGMGITAPGIFPSVYCSKSCEKKGTAHYHTLLFAPGSALPAELAEDPAAAIMPGRFEAQEKFISFLTGEMKERNAPHLLARFLARQIAVETAKMIPGGGDSTAYMADLPPVEQSTGMDYGLWDHVERLRFLAVSVPDEEHEIMKELLSTALPGLETFLTDERHATLKGKLLYNSYGICPEPNGRDKPTSPLRPEDQEKSRTPHGTSRQIGSGFYAVSSYTNHSCDPSATPVFRDGTSRLTLVAQKDIKAGDEVTVAYVDVSQHADETPAEARKRRRWELVRGWRFACVCEKCLADGVLANTATVTVTTGASADEELPKGDESQVEDFVLRGEAKAAGEEIAASSISFVTVPSPAQPGNNDDEAEEETPASESSFVEIASPEVTVETAEAHAAEVPVVGEIAVEPPPADAPVIEVIVEAIPVAEEQITEDPVVEIPTAAVSDSEEEPADNDAEVDNDDDDDDDDDDSDDDDDESESAFHDAEVPDTVEVGTEAPLEKTFAEVVASEKTTNEAEQVQEDLVNTEV